MVEIIKSLIPSGLRQRLSIGRELEAGARYHYFRLCIRQALGLGPSKPGALLQSARTIMFVCHGNIIRSPMSEVFLRHELQRQNIRGITVISSGTNAKTGRRADDRALASAPAFGVSLENHKAQRITPALVELSDIIFVMDFINQAKLAARFPGAKGKTFLIPPTPAVPVHRELPDPYTGALEDVQRCYTALVERIAAIPALLSAEPAPRPSVARSQMREA